MIFISGASGRLSHFSLQSFEVQSVDIMNHSVALSNSDSLVLSDLWSAILPTSTLRTRQSPTATLLRTFTGSISSAYICDNGHLHHWQELLHQIPNLRGWVPLLLLSFTPPQTTPWASHGWKWNWSLLFHYFLLHGYCYFIRALRGRNVFGRGDLLRDSTLHYTPYYLAALGCHAHIK